jgi:hypothetical protein
MPFDAEDRPPSQPHTPTGTYHLHADPPASLTSRVRQKRKSARRAGPARSRRLQARVFYRDVIQGAPSPRPPDRCRRRVLDGTRDLWDARAAGRARSRTPGTRIVVRPLRRLSCPERPAASINPSDPLACNRPAVQRAAARRVRGGAVRLTGPLTSESPSRHQVRAAPFDPAIAPTADPTRSLVQVVCSAASPCSIVTLKQALRSDVAAAVRGALASSVSCAAEWAVDGRRPTRPQAVRYGGAPCGAARVIDDHSRLLIGWRSRGYRGSPRPASDPPIAPGPSAHHCSFLAIPTHRSKNFGARS